MRGAWDLGAVLEVRRLIRRERVSLVHTHSSVDAWVGGLAARAAAVPVVRTRHVSIRIRRRWNPVYRWLADRVITSGEAIRDLVIEAGVDPGRVIAIPAGVDLAEFTGGPGDGEAMRERLGLSRPGVEGLARARGLGEAVVFTGFRTDVPDLLRAMDCFVLASTRTEGVPQSLLQAFAAGVPVVASSIGGIPEVVKHGETGILVPLEDPPALARAIESVLGDRSGASARARAARQMVEDRFSHGASVSRLLALYDEVIAGALPRPVCS
jgi:glycosyltransferase involved in cell wall biosynthesis